MIQLYDPTFYRTKDQLYDLALREPREDEKMYKIHAWCWQWKLQQDEYQYTHNSDSIYDSTQNTLRHHLIQLNTASSCELATFMYFGVSIDVKSDKTSWKTTTIINTFKKYGWDCHSMNIGTSTPKITKVLFTAILQETMQQQLPPYLLFESR